MVLLRILIPVFLFAGNPLHALSSETTREESLRNRRLAKRSQLSAPLLTRAERLLLLVERGGPQGLNFKGFYPEASQFGTGSGFAPRVRYWRPGIQGGLFDLQGSAQLSVRGYQRYDLQLGRVQDAGIRFAMPDKSYQRVVFPGRVERNGARWFLYGELRHQYLPQEDFFGIGSASREDDRTTFTLTETAYEAVAGSSFERWLSGGVRLGFARFSIEEGTDRRFAATQARFDEASAPGLAGQPDFFRLESTAQLDFRDRPENPHRGGIVNVTHIRFSDREDGRYSFDRLSFDARSYVPLGSPQRVVALRFFRSSDRPDSGAEVPFYLLETLGGSHILRGFDKNRFFGHELTAVSVEYRWEALTFVELAVFHDWGRATDPGESDALDAARRSYGFGIRFKSPNALVFRIDLARSEEGAHLYLKFSPSF